MIGRQSSDYYEYEEYSNEEEPTDSKEVILYGLWGLFLFLTIPSIIVFSIFYPSLKYPLDELSHTISDNKTFIKTIELASENNLGGKYICDKMTYTSIISIQKELSSKNIVLLKTHEIFTNGKESRSRAGNFDLTVDSYSDPRKEESYLITGYETMNRGGVFIVGVNYVVPSEGSSLMSSLIDVDDRYDVVYWGNGTQLKPNRDLGWTDLNETLDIFMVVANNQNQPFIQFEDRICYTLKSQLTSQIFQRCDKKMWIENTFYIINAEKKKAYIWMNFEEYQLILTADTRITATSCHLESPIIEEDHLFHSQTTLKYSINN